MTDIISTPPISIRRSSLPRLSLPRTGIGTSLAAIAGALGYAVNLAYVAPFTSLQRQRSVIPDNDLEGRDPNW
jgi:hypothetical protein